MPNEILEQFANCLNDEDKDVRRLAAKALWKESFLNIIKAFESNKNNDFIIFLILHSLRKKSPIYFYEDCLCFGNFKKIKFENKDKVSFIKIFNALLVDFTQIHNIIEIMDSSDKKIIADNYLRHGQFAIKLNQSEIEKNEKYRLTLNLTKKILECGYHFKIEVSFQKEQEMTMFIKLYGDAAGGNNMCSFVEFFSDYAKRNNYKYCKIEYPVFKITDRSEMEHFVSFHGVSFSALCQEENIEFYPPKKEEKENCCMM